MLFPVEGTDGHENGVTLCSRGISIDLGNVQLYGLPDFFLTRIFRAIERPRALMTLAVFPF
jgi:hypothetical protein